MIFSIVVKSRNSHMTTTNFHHSKSQLKSQTHNHIWALIFTRIITPYTSSERPKKPSNRRPDKNTFGPLLNSIPRQSQVTHTHTHLHCSAQNIPFNKRTSEINHHFSLWAINIIFVFLRIKLNNIHKPCSLLVDTKCQMKLEVFTLSIHFCLFFFWIYFGKWIQTKTYV